MHDPMTVAFDLRLPVPQRRRWREKVGPHWTFGRERYTGPPTYEGKAIYPWWRPKAWQPKIAGRSYGWRTFVTVWHVEPNNGDTNPPCGSKRWRWRIHHWHLQVHPWQHFRNRFMRCDECNRRMNTAERHSYMSSDDRFVLHRECMSLRHVRGTLADTDVLVDRLLAAYRVLTDTSEEQALRDALGQGWGNDLWRAVYRLEQRLGYERRHGSLTKRVDA